ncbi:hypothetical protein EXW32_15095 [Bacillus mycoides]|uniref:Uncharacterized protein n=1 Tax=Bacillus mycoides TaxID=1405 RepID=A0A1S9T5Z4_BACMY|nr:hypothetical protein [Bacillus mycoides]PRD11701.1 hypothetical protein CQ058_04005 [Bacillus sp. MYb56]RAN67877.1 hypothetical protein B5P40_22950 [Bacillus sp. SRB_8]TXR82074.1 hypothetical protein DN408_11185 [Bacillus sp. AR13-1]MDR4239544.1 hypothetical protein [Bacillus mycoides]
MLYVGIINILYYENLFFLTHSLQITYVQNSFYYRIEGAFVPEISKFFPINILIKKKHRIFPLLYCPVSTIRSELSHKSVSPTLICSS